MTSPRIIVADEPTGNLDTKTSRSILEFLRGVADDQQQTIIMVTHDIQSASYAHEGDFLKRRPNCRQTCPSLRRLPFWINSMF